MPMPAPTGGDEARRLPERVAEARRHHPHAARPDIVDMPPPSPIRALGAEGRERARAGPEALTHAARTSTTSRPDIGERLNDVRPEPIGDVPTRLEREAAPPPMR